jgi:hypothetical protein
MSETDRAARAGARAPFLYAAAMAVLLVLFVIGGDNGVVYVVSLLGVPIASGVLAGLGLIRFWHAVVGCLSVVILDVAFDETRAEDLVFFLVLAVVMVGIAALARLVTRWAAHRRSHPRGVAA